MIKLIDLYFANNNWDDDTLLTLGGCIRVAEIPAHKAAETYGDHTVVCFINNIVNLM